MMESDVTDQTKTEDKQDTPSQEISRVDAPYDPRQIEQVIAGPKGLVFPNLPALVEGSKLMARAGIALPPHCRDEPGVCFAILLHCENWRIRNPIFIANHSYVVTQNKKYKDENGRDAYDQVQTLAFDAMVFHAVIAASGLIELPVDYQYEGVGADRKCTVSVKLRENGKVVSYTTPEFGKIHPKNSPLWTSNPDMQQGYYAIRNLGRAYFPLALGGVYDKDEFDETTQYPTNAPASPKLIERLKGKADALRPEEVNQALETHTGEEPAAGKGNGRRQRQRKDTPAATETTEMSKPGDTVLVSGAGGMDGGYTVVEPKTAAEYKVYAGSWIAGITEATAEAADSRWESEMDMREACGVSVKERNRLRGMMEEKIKQFPT